MEQNSKKAWIAYVNPGLFFLLGLFVGAYVYAQLFDKERSNPMPDNQQSILLEKIKQVSKMITVEGEFANIHQYNDPGWNEFSMFSKKALIRVKARVSVGYDLNRATYEVDEEKKILRIKNLPNPEVLSIDHNLEYYDISEGMFNSFSEKELSSIGVVAKNKLRKMTENGPLMQRARVQGLQHLELVRVLVEDAGWTFEVEQGDSLMENDFEDDDFKKEYLH